MPTRAQAIILHLYKWTEKSMNSAHEASLIAQPKERKIMLESKRKAYSDVLNHIKGKYGADVDFNYITPE